jgi:chromate reductase
MGEGGIRVVVIGGSVRPGNLTARAAALVVDELGKSEGVEAAWIDPASLDLALPGTAAHAKSSKALQERLAGATGVVLATPEYHGSYSSVIKLVIENLGFPSALAGKPVALLGVAAGRIGAIQALGHLRAVCTHVGALVLPGSVSVAGVQGVFDGEGRCTDAATEKQIRGVAKSMLDYVHGAICPKVTLEAMMREKAARG